MSQFILYLIFMVLIGTQEIEIKSHDYDEYVLKWIAWLFLPISYLCYALFMWIYARRLSPVRDWHTVIGWFKNGH